MTQGAGGTVLDEPTPDDTRRARRSKARPSGRAKRAPAPPEGGDEGVTGVRQARRARAQRQRFWFVLMPAVAVLLAVSVLVGALLRNGSDDSSSGAASSNAAGSTRAPGTLLLGHRGADGRLDLLVLVGARSNDASVLLLPAATQVEVPSLGPQTLADLPDDSEHALLRTTVENLLGVRVGKAVVLDDAGLVGAISVAAPLNVDLHREVQFAEGSDGIVPAGLHRTSGEQAARWLVVPQPGSELDRLVTVQDVLDAWQRRLRSPAVAKDTLTIQPELAALIAAARTSQRRTDTLPVESVTTGGSERFDPRAADVTKYADAAFPNALLAVGGKRPRVEILNGTGAVGLAQTIANRVVPAGGQVTLTGNVKDFGLPKTQVVYYRKTDRDAAQRLLRALGCGALKKSESAFKVVDVTILAGADCFRTGETPTP